MRLVFARSAFATPSLTAVTNDNVAVPPMDANLRLVCDQTLLSRTDARY